MTLTGVGAASVTPVARQPAYEIAPGVWRIPVMTDDAIASPQDALNLLRLGGVERVKVKVTKHGFDGAATHAWDS